MTLTPVILMPSGSLRMVSLLLRASTDAQNRFNYTVTRLKDSVDQLQSHADASAVAQVRIRFNELERANQALSSTDATTSMRNRHELERIGMELNRIEDAQFWSGLKR
ncbi:hypothetical protein [Comamonas sp. C24C]